MLCELLLFIEMSGFYAQIRGKELGKILCNYAYAILCLLLVLLS